MLQLRLTLSQAPTGNPQQPFGVTDAERDEAYLQWLQGKSALL